MRSVVAIMALLLAGCSPNERVWSSRTSPDGSFLAVNLIIGDGVEAAGRLVIRAKDGLEHHIGFVNAADLFLKWRDDRHLELWTERQAVDLKGVDRLGEVNLIAKSYDFPMDVKTAYSRSGVTSRTVTVPVNEVVATFQPTPLRERQRSLLRPDA